MGHRRVAFRRARCSDPLLGRLQQELDKAKAAAAAAKAEAASLAASGARLVRAGVAPSVIRFVRLRSGGQGAVAERRAQDGRRQRQGRAARRACGARRDGGRARGGGQRRRRRGDWFVRRSSVVCRARVEVFFIVLKNDSRRRNVSGRARQGGRQAGRHRAQEQGRERQGARRVGGSRSVRARMRAPRVACDAERQRRRSRRSGASWRRASPSASSSWKSSVKCDFWWRGGGAPCECLTTTARDQARLLAESRNVGARGRARRQAASAADAAVDAPPADEPADDAPADDDED